MENQPNLRHLFSSPESSLIIGQSRTPSRNDFSLMKKKVKKIISLFKEKEKSGTSHDFYYEIFTCLDSIKIEWIPYFVIILENCSKGFNVKGYISYLEKRSNKIRKSEKEDDGKQSESEEEQNLSL